MIRPIQRFLQALPPGVRGVLLLLAGAWAINLVGNLTGWFSLPHWAGWSSSAVWKGQVWRLATYSLIPAGLLDLVGTAVFLLMCGPPVERAWSRGEFWSYCFLAALGTGAAGLLLRPWGATVTGFGGVCYALLAAWARLEGHQHLEFAGIGAMSVRVLAGLAALVMFLSSAALAGLATALASASSAVVGWLYLSVRWRWIESRQARLVAYGRGRRLEL